MSARIFRPTKSATQSGAGRTKKWRLVYDPQRPRTIDPLMGWTSSDDMTSRSTLTFDTKEEAVAYAERNGIAFTIEEPQAGRAPDDLLLGQFPSRPRRPVDPLNFSRTVCAMR